MLVLGIDTATARSSVTLCDGRDVLCATSSQIPRRHGEFVAPAVKFVCDIAGVSARDLDVVAVDVGPGLYTGMRVGIGFGQSLAFATGATTAAITSTDALAYTVRHLIGECVVAVDGRRGEVFLATYSVDGTSVHTLTPARVMPIGDAVRLLDGRHVAVVGDGFSLDVLDAAGVPHAARHQVMPDATAVALCAQDQIAAGVVNPVLAPVYLRQADAKIGWETRGKLGHDGAS